MEFPPGKGWCVEPVECFDSATCTDQNSPVTAQVLLQMSGLTPGAFRVVLGGYEAVDVRFPAAAVLGAGASAFELSLQTYPRDITLQQNTASSRWIDLQEQVAGRYIAVHGSGAQADDSKSADSLLELLDKSKKGWGASLRWAVVIGAGLQLELVLQALPCQASVLDKSPLLRADNVPAIQVHAWPLRCAMFDGVVAAGPVPILYTDSPVEDAKTIEDSPPDMLRVLSSLCRQFIRPEIIGWNEAVAVVKKPREGRGLQALTTARLEPPAKRVKAGPAQETGKILKK